MRWFLFLLCLMTPLHAADRTALYGTWGTPAQCDRQPILDGGTKLAEPFEIHPGWLRHGALWCRLSWFPIQPRENGLFVGTSALCGEDSANSYRLDFALDRQSLTLIWNNSLINGPLARCPGDS